MVARRTRVPAVGVRDGVLRLHLLPLLLLGLLGACSPPVPVPAQLPSSAPASTVVRPTAAGEIGEVGEAGETDYATCTVERVVDGDTLVCDDGVRVRLLLIDAPELSQGPYGEVAKQWLEELAGAGTVLAVVHDVQRLDRYGRTLAYMYLPDGRMVNEELLRAGVAVVAVYPPNVRHVDRLRAAVDSARTAGAGLWATPAFECAPRDHRARVC